MTALYHAAISKNTVHDGSSSIPSNFDANLSSTARNKAMYNYMEVIISLSFPISYVKNPKFRGFSGCDVSISLKELRETICKLFEIIEVAIRNELKGTRGTIMHDAWTKNGSHYLAIYALFIRKVSRTIEGRSIQ